MACRLEMLDVFVLFTSVVTVSSQLLIVTLNDTTRADLFVDIRRRAVICQSDHAAVASRHAATAFARIPSSLSSTLPSAICLSLLA